MAVITHITSTEKIVAANHPFGFTDTKNRAIQELYDVFIAEHSSSDGTHNIKTSMMIGEIDTFIGTGSSHTISLSNSNLTPLLVIAWADVIGTPAELALNFVSGTVDRVSAGTIALSLSNLVQGSFDANDTNSVTYYYITLGIDTTSTFTGDVGAGSDPTWLEDGDSLYGDGTGSSPANQVEDAIETAFEHEHTAAGSHGSLFDGVSKIEIGTYEGDGTDNRDITLSDSSLNVKEIIVYISNAATKTESMAGDNTKIENAAAFAANYIQSVGTGTFQIGTAINSAPIDYYYVVIGVQ